MPGIVDIATHVPPGRLSNLDPQRLAAFEMDASFVRDKLGVLSCARMEEGEGTTDLAVSALSALMGRNGLLAEDIQALVVVTQNPDRNIPHTSAAVHGRLGLSAACAAFDVGLGCSGYVYGLSVLHSFLLANGLQRGVLITADPYSKIVHPDDKATATLFGDAATATLIGPSPVYELGPFAFGTWGQSGAALQCDDGVLHMNGREVFNFAATRVVAQVQSLLARATLEADAVDAFLFHQGSRYIVDTLRQRLKLPEDKVRLGLQEVGNLVSSSIPAMLEKELARPDVRSLLLSGFGVGLSWASCVCHRVR